MTGQTEDGEMFVDSWGSNPIPVSSAWNNLSQNELLKIKIDLENKLLAFGNTPMAPALQQGIAKINAMLSSAV